MPVAFAAMRAALNDFDFRHLFVELFGWGRANARIIPFEYDSVTYTFTPIAEAGGMVVLLCQSSVGEIPTTAARQRIERHITPFANEHILIFTDAKRTTALWQWVKLEDGRAALRPHKLHKGQSADALLQRLAYLELLPDDLDEEGRIRIGEVRARAARAFDVERVTRRFYDLFKAEHDRFRKFLVGIEAQGDLDWYTSVMLNRLMFLYFIQKKRFLDNNPDYLRRQLERSDAAGENYYRDFLRDLFFEGMSKEPKERLPAIAKRLGKVPYLNGGLFLLHQVEARWGDAIQIQNAAFTNLFRFFDSYTWHLNVDDLVADNEVNPDVLGYIFEKYINQKEMGAYYTKEDITGYICRSTILPFLLDKVGVDIQAVMHELDPYVFDAVKTNDYLPTETPREYAARKKRYAQMQADFAAGKIATVNDLITYNLDIVAIAEDWIRHTSVEQLRKFYFEALSSVTVLDPTCGSGAFLFAAIQILEPLYDVALERMVAFADPLRARDFVSELEVIDQHPSRSYYILKRIIVNNLYGVDIMDEAVEICKLRLFLKLAAQVDDPDHIEPLPDIDFNIRAGNTLVGFATKDEIAPTTVIRMYDAQALLHMIDVMEGALKSFRRAQLSQGVTAEQMRTIKRDIQSKLADVRDILDAALMDEYGQKDLAAFRSSHKPFHWYVEFHNILSEGRFDVLVGNPPYVASRTVDYLPRGLSSPQFADIYGHVVVRSLAIARPGASLGLILPLSLVFSEDFVDLRLIITETGMSWFSSFDNIPAAVFYGVSQRCTIWLHRHIEEHQMFSTPMLRWRSEFRPFLTARLRYTPLAFHEVAETGVPKVDSPSMARILNRILEFGDRRDTFPRRSSAFISYSQTARNFVSAYVIPPPNVDVASFKEVPGSQQGELFVKNEAFAFAMMAVFLGETFFWYWMVRGDGFHVTSGLLASFGAVLTRLDRDTLQLVSRLGHHLSEYRFAALQFKKNAGRYVGNFNYSSFTHLTRRADLIFLSALGCSFDEALEIFDYVQRVRSINIFAGERSIPPEVKARYVPPPADIVNEAELLDDVDAYLTNVFRIHSQSLSNVVSERIELLSESAADCE